MMDGKLLDGASLAVIAMLAALVGAGPAVLTDD